MVLMWLTYESQHLRIVARLALMMSRTTINNTLRDAVPLVLQAVTASLNPAIEDRQVESALKCLEAWLTYIPAKCAIPVLFWMLILTYMQ